MDSPYTQPILSTPHLAQIVISVFGGTSPKLLSLKPEQRVVLVAMLTNTPSNGGTANEIFAAVVESFIAIGTQNKLRIPEVVSILKDLQSTGLVSTNDITMNNKTEVWYSANVTAQNMLDCPGIESFHISQLKKKLMGKEEGDDDM